MKMLFLSLMVTLLSLEIKAQEECNLIENNDPTLTKVSYQTVFVTLVDKKDKFNIKFWKFKDKYSISCFVVTKDTFCVNQSSTVTFNFADNTKYSFRSDKKQNCRAELNKDFKNEEVPASISSFNKKVRSISVSGINSSKTFIADEKTSALLLGSFHCILQKKIR